MIIFVLAFGGFLMGVPAIRIYEDIICHHYYENLEGEGHIGLEKNIDEKDCKGDEVQNELNFLLAVLHFLGTIPGMQTFPLGYSEGALVTAFARPMQSLEHLRSGKMNKG
jgi:hypothetical protein